MTEARLKLAFLVFVCAMSRGFKNYSHTLKAGLNGTDDLALKKIFKLH